MVIRRDPRAQNARTHGLAVAHYEPSALRVMADIADQIAGAGAQHRRRAAERLVTCFFEVRRTTGAKLALLEHAAETLDDEGAGLHAYARAFSKVLSSLVTLERYERRAESQFFSASRQFVTEENTTRGVSLA
jgi:hypothetical protein